MPIFPLDNSIEFPHPSLAEPDGLLAIGGDLSAARLLQAYRSGIFPWFEGDVPLWWSPDPRFVLFPNALQVSKSMKQLIRKQTFTYTRNKAFTEVLCSCKTIDRPGQVGTWITPGMQAAYTELHRKGYAISAEAWVDHELVGGLYGIRMGKLFFGESMFSKQSNASKFAFIMLVRDLVEEGVVMVDCQVHTNHLQSLGAELIKRDVYLDILEKYL
jgi:leucyl/phenylalanyl-tRNA---protein transferase